MLIVSISNKRKGIKTKGLLIVSIILYCISFAIILIPTAWIGFLRFSNQETFDDYVKTGVYVSSTANEIYREGKFYYNGDLYVKLDSDLSGSEFEVGEAVANAKSGGGFIDNVLDKIFNYNDKTTIYSVINDSGYTILKCGWSKYCREVDKDKINNYYRTLPEYKYSYYKFGSGIEDVDMEFNKEVFEILHSLRRSGEDEVTITDDYAVEYSIKQTSPDGVYYRDVYVLLTKDSAYVVALTSGSTYTCYQLDELTIDYVKEKLEFKPI